MNFKVGEILITKREIQFRDRKKGLTFIPKGELVEVEHINKKMGWITISYNEHKVIISNSMYDSAFQKKKLTD